MFEQGGRTFVGMVINNDTTVIDLSRANVSAPATLKQLIAGWDAQHGTRMAALAASSAAKPPAFAMPVAQVKTLPPIPDPGVLLNAAVNYSEHGLEMTGQRDIAASADKVDPKVAMGIPSVLDAEARRPAPQPVLLPQGEHRRSPATAIRSSCRRAARRSIGSASSTS